MVHRLMVRKMSNNIPYKRIEIMVIPTDYCNMNCVYCFNERRTGNYCSKNIMSEETLEQLCRITLPYYEEVVFLWHGGEPLSAGMDFYKMALRVQSMYSGEVRIRNRMQTNLSLMTREYADFLTENGFNIGSSYDGINNDLTRGNSEQILRGYRNVKSSNGNIGFIYVAQAKNIDNLIEDYQWFKSQGMNYTINSYKSTDKMHDRLYVAPDRYYNALNELFDVWLYDKGCNIHVAIFEEYVRYFIEGKKSKCCYTSCLGKHLAIYPNGDIYNCNRDFSKEYCFGNISEYNDIHECFSSEGFKKLLNCAYTRRQNCREKCDIYKFCMGGCNSDAAMGGDISAADQDECIGLKSFYYHVSDKISLVKEEILNSRGMDFNPYVVDCINRWCLIK